MDEFHTYGEADLTAKDAFSKYGNFQIGEPRRALYFSTILVFFPLFLGNLESIALLISILIRIYLF